MWLFSFYRFYTSVALGIAAGILMHAWWVGVIAAVTVRVGWGFIERIVEKMQIDRSFKTHAYSFKQELGPYGIRMINKAEKEPAVKKQLAEVFTDDEKKLRKALEQLEMMDTLFNAGMRPDGDTYQLHDLKLKYGKWRIEQMEKARSAVGSSPAGNL